MRNVVLGRSSRLPFTLKEERIINLLIETDDFREENIETVESCDDCAGGAIHSLIIISKFIIIFTLKASLNVDKLLASSASNQFMLFRRVN